MQLIKCIKNNNLYSNMQLLSWCDLIIMIMKVLGHVWTDDVPFYTECVIRIVQGPRGAAQLIVKNYMFLKRSTMGLKTYWRCCMYSRYSCRARCVTGEDGSLVQYCEHSHKPDLKKLVNKPVLRETIYKINAE